MMMSARREPTLADVARVAGVSLTTVSRVLNNRGYLSQEVKDRVAEAITELNYRPNQVARALHGKSTHTIGVIVPTVALPFFGEMAAEIENALTDHGYRILVCNSMGRAEREREYLDLPPCGWHHLRRSQRESIGVRHRAYASGHRRPAPVPQDPQCLLRQ